MRRRVLPQRNDWVNPAYQQSQERSEELLKIAFENPGQNAAKLYDEKLAARKAAGGITPEFLEEIKQAGISQDNLEMMEESARQLRVAQDIHGKTELAAYMDPRNPSRTVEQQVSKGLLERGELPSSMPPDRVLGAYTTMSPRETGIDGAFKSDSEIRRHALSSLNDQGDLIVDRSDIRTEILSPRGVEEAFDTWATNSEKQYQKSIKKGRKVFKPKLDRGQFNRAAGEYYGQQALRLKGYSPVLDADRSKHIKNTTFLENNALGSDRLIENSRTLTRGDIGTSSDFRVVNEGGEIEALDYQMGRNPNNSINASLIKSGARDFKGNEGRAEQQFIEAAQKLKAEGKSTDLDTVMQSMVESGLLPRPKAGFSARSENNMMPGKFLSNADYLGAVNTDDQHRMAGVLYGHFDDIYGQYGMLPTGHSYYSADKVRDYIGGIMAQGKMPKGNGLFSHNSGKGDLHINLSVNPSGFLRGDKSGYNTQLSEGPQIQVGADLVKEIADIERAKMLATQMPF